MIFIVTQTLSQCSVGLWLTMIDFNIETRWKMVGQWFSKVDFHIKTIFVTIWCWTMVDHGWPWLSQCDVQPRDNLCHHVTMVIDRGWLWFIYISRQLLLEWDAGMRRWNMVDHGWFSYWDNPCYNVTLDHGWPWLILIPRQFFSKWVVWLWLTMVDFHI